MYERTITLREQIDTVVREIKMRERVYRSRVASGKMRQAEMDYEIACMKAVLETLTSPAILSKAI
jgi:hypothetical protein